jgi:hypothetical protein
MMMSKLIKEIEDKIDPDAARKARADVRKHGTVSLA